MGRVNGGWGGGKWGPILRKFRPLRKESEIISKAVKNSYFLRKLVGSKAKAETSVTSLSVPLHVRCNEQRQEVQHHLSSLPRGMF